MKDLIKLLNTVSSGVELISEKSEPFIGVLRKKCSENMHQVYRRTTMQKCDFNKVASQLY